MLADVHSGTPFWSKSPRDMVLRPTRCDRCPQSGEPLPHLACALWRAPSEIGRIAQAFNAIMGNLHRLEDTIETVYEDTQPSESALVDTSSQSTPPFEHKRL